MRWPGNFAIEAAKRREERPGVGAGSTGSELERKYGVALALYVVLAVLVWFTIGEGKISVLGRLIEIRWVPIFVLATFAFRTMMAMQADRIRRRSKE